MARVGECDKTQQKVREGISQPGESCYPHGVSHHTMVHGGVETSRVNEESSGHSLPILLNRCNQGRREEEAYV